MSGELVCFTIPKLLELLRRASDGEDPDILLLELWGNAWHVDDMKEGEDE